MSKLRAAIRALEHLHKHVLQYMQKEFVHAKTAESARKYRGNISNYDTLDYDKQFYDEIYRIHLGILDILKTMHALAERRRYIRNAYTRIRREMNQYLSPFWHNLDKRKILGERIDHQVHFNNTYRDIEEGMDSILEEERTEEQILKEVDNLLERLTTLLDRIARRCVEYEEKHYYMTDRHDRVSIWKKLLGEIRQGLEQEKKLIGELEQGNREAGKELRDLRQRHHTFLRKLDYERFFEIPSKADLAPDVLLEIARKAGIKEYRDGQGKIDYRRIAKSIRNKDIINYFSGDDVLKEFERFYEEERKRLASITP